MNLVKVTIVTILWRWSTSAPASHEALFLVVSLFAAGRGEQRGGCPPSAFLRALARITGSVCADPGCQAPASFPPTRQGKKSFSLGWQGRGEPSPGTQPPAGAVHPLPGAARPRCRGHVAAVLGWHLGKIWGCTDTHRASQSESEPGFPLKSARIHCQRRTRLHRSRL